MTPSIFTIERRKDFNISFTTFFEDLQTEITTLTGATYKFDVYLDRCVRFWPHRCGAVSIDDYMKGIGIDITKPEKDQDLILTLELLINLLHWAPKQDSNDQQDMDFSVFNRGVETEANRMLTNAAYILEQCCNMRIREEYDETFPKYYVYKRDEKIDAAVVAVPKLGDVLLGYLDIRNEDNLEYKQSALIEIYKYLEPRRKEYRELPCKAASEEFFACMNKFGIRHNSKSQVNMRGRSRKRIYDKLFLLGVYVLQSESIEGIMKELRGIRGN